MDVSTPAAIEGYSKLAHHMGAYSSAQIFHRFSSLNAESLFYQQAELVHLEIELGRLEAADKSSQDVNKRYYANGWY